MATTTHSHSSRVCWHPCSSPRLATPRPGLPPCLTPIKEIGQLYAVEDWTFAGTSEGSVSAFHAARMNPQLARRTILTASLFQSSRNGPGLLAVTWTELAGPLLWAHHEDDPCAYTSYRDARAFCQKSGNPLLTVRGGGPWRGAACEAFTAHGFAGVERETVHALQSWVKTGIVPPDVKPSPQAHP